MPRFTFILAASIAFAFALPALSRAQTPEFQTQAPQAAQPGDDEVGNVAAVQGNVTATHNNVSRRLKVQDPILKGDVLRTGLNATLDVIFDDETTFNLSANATITVDNFLYESGGKDNSALFKVARGTVAFAANQVAKTGDMKIETPSSTLGIRGTSGLIEVPEGATPGSSGEVAVKLYADADGRVGRIELFGAGGGPRLGLLTRAATGFALRPGAGGRFAAVALTISPLQAARDRGFVQRTFAARNTGRSMIDQRRNLRAPGLQRQQPGLRQPGQRAPGLQQPGSRPPNGPRPGALPPAQRGFQPQSAPGVQGQPRPGGAPNVQRPNLQRPPAAPGARRPAGRNAPKGKPASGPPPR